MNSEQNGSMTRNMGMQDADNTTQTEEDLWKE